MKKKFVKTLLIIGMFCAVLAGGLYSISAKETVQKSANDSDALTADIGLIAKEKPNYLASVLGCEVLIFSGSLIYLKLNRKKQNSDI